MNYQVKTTEGLESGEILQEVIRQIGGVEENIQRQIMRTKEAQTHKALVDLGWTPPGGYRVSVQKMVENHRVTWWVCLDRPDRPLDAKPWDAGRMAPYMSEDKEKAVFAAAEWAVFLGTSVLED